MGQHRGILPAIWLLALLLLPAGIWVLGGRQAVLENRPKANRPALSSTTLRQKETFDQLEAFIRDRLPLRETALSTRARILVDVFNVSTNPMVAIGDNGWLYFTPELENCQPGPGMPISDPADAIEVLTRTVTASGRDATVAVAPSKIFIHTKDVPSLDPGLTRCAYELEKRVQTRLKQTPGGVDLMTPLLEMEAAGKHTYLQNDTHWNWRGRLFWAKIMLDGVRPGLANEVGLKSIPLANREGDLGLMLGVPRNESDRIIEASRAPDPVPKTDDYVIVGDSQSGSALVDPSRKGTPIAESVLPGVALCSWQMLGAGECDTWLASSKRAVFEIVGRGFGSLTNQCWRPVAVVAQDFRGTPGGWDVDGAAETRSGSIAVPAAGKMTVRVRPVGGDLSTKTRLMRIPISPPAQLAVGDGAAVTVAQKPTNGPPAPCATPAQTIEGRSLFLPIPANRRASDLALELSAPPGTRFGRPQEIVLDGRTVKSN